MLFSIVVAINQACSDALCKSSYDIHTEVEILLNVYLTFPSNSTNELNCSEVGAKIRRVLCRPHLGNWLSWQVWWQRNLHILKEWCHFLPSVSSIIPAGRQAAPRLVSPGKTQEHMEVFL